MQKLYSQTNASQQNNVTKEKQISDCIQLSHRKMHWT